MPKTAAFQTLICIFARKSSEYGIINFNKNMPAPKKYYFKRRLAKAMHSIWSQDWKSNGVMVQKSVGHKSKRKGMRSLRLVNLPDGKVRMLCQMTKRRAEELKRQGIAVELIAPVDKVSGMSRRRAQKSRVHSELTFLQVYQRACHEQHRCHIAHAAQPPIPE